MRTVSNFAPAIVLTAVVLTLQILSGAYHADFDASADEPAHVVSSLMVRDYLVSGTLMHPWEFAQTYYVHYPKVAILHWPPLFHLLEAIWMLAAGRSRIALLAFQAAVGAALVIAVFMCLRREQLVWVAFLAAAVLAFTGTVQATAAMVSPDLLLALLVFCAAAEYAQYTITGNSRCAWWSAAFAVAALATHGRAAPLLLLPIVAPLLVRVTALRLAALLAVVLAYILLPTLLGQAYPFSPTSTFHNSLEFAWRLASAVTWPVFALTLIGIAAAFRGPQRSGARVMIALLLSCWIFHSVVRVPFSEIYLITALPATIVLAAGGAAVLLRFAPRTAEMSLVALFVCVAVADVYAMQRKPSLGARSLVADNSIYLDPQTIWLVAGTPVFEGAVIAETALRDRHQEHIVLRASKMLARSTWSGDNYRPVFQNWRSVSDFLDGAHIGWVICQDELSTPHGGQLMTALLVRPQKFQQIRWLTLFKRIQPILQGKPKIEIDMQDRFGSTFRLHE
jgi:4-amino-4-deoxy-L-arabinose transferase-like glycosyltransferase